MEFNQIIDFWFEEIKPKQWWVKDSGFDALIRTRFADVHQKATQGELFAWRETTLGRLAEVLILDQFSRNIFRNQPEAFQFDSLALVLAQECISQNLHEQIETGKRSFLYMPFMHSESKLIHEKAVELFSTPGMEGGLDFELRHKKIIDRFGRYPHRNKILGRQSTPEEIAFLDTPGSSF